MGYFCPRLLLGTNPMAKLPKVRTVETTAANGLVDWRMKVDGSPARSMVSGEVVRGGRAYRQPSAYMSGRAAAVMNSLTAAATVSALMRWRQGVYSYPVEPRYDNFVILCAPADADALVEAIEVLLASGDEGPARAFVEMIEAQRLGSGVCAHMPLAVPA